MALVKQKLKLQLWVLFIKHHPTTPLESLLSAFDPVLLTFFPCSHVQLLLYLTALWIPVHIVWRGSSLVLLHEVVDHSPGLVELLQRLLEHRLLAEHL